MNENFAPVTSILGALLVAEGLVAPEQLAASILLQQHDYPNLSLDKILLRCGYVSREGLDYALHMQRVMQDALTAALEAQLPIPVDIDVLVISARSSPMLTSLLTHMGASVRYSRVPPCDLESQRPDIVLIDLDLLPSCGDLPDWCQVELLPPAMCRCLYTDGVPAEMRRLLERYVRRARAERTRQDDLAETRKHDHELHALMMVTRRIAQTSTARDLLSRLVGLVRDLLLVEAATLFRVDMHSERLVFEVVLGPNQQALTQKSIPISQGIAGWVARHGEPLIIPDVHLDQRFTGMIDHTTGFQTRSMLCVPMNAFGKLHGVLQLINKQDGEFTEHDLQLLRIIASFGALALAGTPMTLARSPQLRERALAATT